jgi:hypothetical protein
MSSMRFFSLPRRQAVMMLSPSLSSHTSSKIRSASSLLFNVSVQPSQWPCGYSFGYHQRQIMAFYWMDVVRFKIDKNTGRRIHEDPEDVVKRHQEERRSDGQSLLDMDIWNDRHEKRWMRRKRLSEKRRYEFDKKHVNDLAKYIAFVQKK